MKNSFHVVFSCQKPGVATFVMPVYCWSKDLKSCQLEHLNTGLTWLMPGECQISILMFSLSSGVSRPITFVIKIKCTSRTESTRLLQNLTHFFLRAGPGVKNFVRERRRESCRERSLAYKRKHLFNKNTQEDIIDQG